MENQDNFKLCNLYVKNLPPEFDDERLHTEFANFGTIISAKVMMDGDHSKGFGFVCFTNPEDAARAVSEMNGRTLGSRPLYVALALKKDERRSHLAPRHHYNLRSYSSQQQNQFPQQDAACSFHVAPMSAPPAMYTGVMMPFIASSPIAAGGQEVEAAYVNFDNGYNPILETNETMITRSSVRVPWDITRQIPIAPAPTASIPTVQVPLRLSMLAAVCASERTQILGSRLFPLVHDMFLNLTGTIVNMLLERDYTEVFYMLEHREYLRAQVDEIVALINAHGAEQDDYNNNGE